MSTRIEVHNEVRLPQSKGYHLCFQDVTYHFDWGDEPGFRFIWRDPNDNLLPSRGQARIPDKVTLERLLKKAKSKGWYK
jgi:hypothetical protein